MLMAKKPVRYFDLGLASPAQFTMSRAQNYSKKNLLHLEMASLPKEPDEPIEVLTAV